MSTLPISNPKALGELGEAIYTRRYKEEYERVYAGKFVAIDVRTENAYLADTPEGAFEAARTAAPQGLFHLIQVGQAGAFRVSYSQASSVDWIFQ
jgi:hypothetical protein